MILETLAGKAVGYFVDNVTGGALEKLGADAKDYLQRLVGLIYTYFSSGQEVQQATSNPNPLKEAIIQKASTNVDFREDLEKLVKKLEEIENSQLSVNFSQSSTGEGANIKADKNTGNVAGRDQNFRN
ncbi:MAG: hypothetical protein F6K31_10370 [Symploca sp. SIO2G7]|nr:hypothetical protein [Symploca sp. SIO2G7]